jgi:DNA topoisomerase-3
LRPTFAAKAGNYTGKWFDEGFKGKDEDEHARADRIWEQNKADAIRAATLGKAGIVTEEAKPETRLSPLLFDLTSLQREANGRFGFSAKTTLSLAQALYEKHKVLTYPRTDSRCLPEDYIATVKATLSVLTGEGAGKGMTKYSSPATRHSPTRSWRVTGYIRTSASSTMRRSATTSPSSRRRRHPNLNELEQKLYDFVVKRFLSVFFPAAEYLVTTRITRIESHPFKTEGKVLVNPGWLAVHGKEGAGRQRGNLVAVDTGEKVKTEDVTVKANETKPPPRYSEATLLSAMEGAGKMVDDEELKAAMAGRGLGTPATRAQIIENLIGEQYMHREGRELIPTAKAFSLMTLLNGLGINELTQPELTGDWEWKLGRIEKGDFTRDEFMREIAEMTRHIVERAKTFDSDTIPGDFGVLTAPCPRCGGQIRETYKKFQCGGCDYALWKIVAGRQFEPAEIDTLITEKQIGPLTGFRNKMGRAFAAAIKLNDKMEPEFDFGQDKAGEATKPKQSISPAERRLGKCPKCAAGVFDHGASYVCEKSSGPAKTCDFRSGKIILQQPIESEQMQEAAGRGQNRSVEGVSFPTARAASSRLTWSFKEGKVGFEFEKKAPVRRHAYEEGRSLIHPTTDRRWPRRLPDRQRGTSTDSCRSGQLAGQQGSADGINRLRPWKSDPPDQPDRS